MDAPADSLIFGLLCRLRVLTPDEAEKVNVRFCNASAGQSLIEFLLQGGYLDAQHVARLRAMARSTGGNLTPEERETLEWVCAQLTEVPMTERRPSGQDTSVNRNTGDVKKKTLVDMRAIEPRDES